MKKGYFFFAMGLILLIEGANAQPPDNVDGFNVKLNSLRHDTSYMRFEVKLKNIMKGAKGKQTNYAAVKKLFASNKAMLQGLQKKYDLAAALTVSGNQNDFMVYKNHPLPGLAKAIPMTTNIRVLKGPFSSGLTKESTTVWEIIKSGNNITWPKYYDAGNFHELGWAGFYFTKEIMVPDDPTIVGARLEFDYSFFITGWETGGGQFFTQLGIWVDDKFICPDYSSMSSTSIQVNPNNSDTYKTATQFYGGTFLEPRDFVYSKDSTFTIEGYVAPGKQFVVSLAAGYPDQTRTGGLGAYHYGEFELKKIVVTFLKAGQ